jgi:serine/threonine protein kinase
MITERAAKIGDFGCAVYGYCMRKSQICSPGYLSPEQLHHNIYGKKIDIWSIGIMTY